MSQPLFSVIICTYQRYDLLPQAIDSVLAQTLDPDLFDLWIMDNSPDSLERKMFARSYAGNDRLHYQLLDQPGLANARNEGAKASTGQYVVFMDDDAVAVPGWLAAYRDAFAATEGKVGAFGGRIVPKFEEAPPSWFSRDLYNAYSLIDWSDKIRELPKGSTLIGANVVFTRETLARYGGFSTAFGRRGLESGNLLSGEESELFERMQADGYRLFYTPLAEVSHFVPKSRLNQAWLRRRLAWQAITDQMKNPMNPQNFLALFAHTSDYLKLVPPEHRTFMGLFWDTEDPEIFKKQLSAVYMTTKILIAAGKYPDEIRF